jgi:hypothetical protein
MAEFPSATRQEVDAIRAGDTQLALLLGDKAGKKGAARIPGYSKMLLVKGTGENKKAVENKRKVLINPAFSGNVTGMETVKRVVVVK